MRSGGDGRVRERTARPGRARHGRWIRHGARVGRGVLGEDYRVIAPSRFGYLRTPLPANASHVAQADTLASLLDALGVTRAVVLAVSAGAQPATHLALRHPERVQALVLITPALHLPPEPGVPSESGPPGFVLDYVLASDFMVWAIAHLAPKLLVRAAGVPPSLDHQMTPTPTRLLMSCGTRPPESLEPRRSSSNLADTSWWAGMTGSGRRSRGSSARPGDQRGAPPWMTSGHPHQTESRERGWARDHGHRWRLAADVPAHLRWRAPGDAVDASPRRQRAQAGLIRWAGEILGHRTPRGSRGRTLPDRDGKAGYASGLCRATARSCWTP